MKLPVEALYDYQQLHPDDLLGTLIKYEEIEGIVNNKPLRRKTVPTYIIEMYLGSDRAFSCYIKDQDLNIINLTGAVGTFTLRQVKGGTLIFQKVTSNSAQGAIGSADQGQVLFYLLPADTSTLTAGQYVWDISIVVGGKTYLAVCEGVINLLKSVT